MIILDGERGGGEGEGVTIKNIVGILKQEKVKKTKIVEFKFAIYR